jgi:membrane associated rhomboid family serine protease
MLEDRSYMRRPAPHPAFGISVWMMIVLTVIYAFQCINDIYLRIPIDVWLPMTTSGLRQGYIWQLLTFQFVHVNLWHLAGNLITLWFFGRYVEGILGTRKFLIAYFIGGFAGGILQGVLMLIFPFHFGPAVYGASAGLSAIFAIFATIESQSEVRLYFVLPVKARVLLYIFAGIALFFTLVPTPREGGVAHAAHLGGILAGLAYIRWDSQRSPMNWNPLQGRRRKRQLVQAAAQITRWRGQRDQQAAELPPEEFISKEVDPILDKILAHGFQSLTPREKKILEAAHSKIAKR